jgi:NitT/TauT family transport system permease protein
MNKRAREIGTEKQKRIPPVREEFEIAPSSLSQTVIGDISRPLPFWEKLTNSIIFRRIFILVALGAAWEIYARIIDDPLLVPTLTDTLKALFVALQHELPGRILTSLRILAIGYAAGLCAAAILTLLAASNQMGSELLSTLTAMFNPLPAIALLPLALLWFGLGTPSLVFVIIHSVVWAVALNTHSGFRAVSETQRMAGLNCGLRGIRYVLTILIPAAFPSILTGLKIGWAFAWRTLIAAELVFGSSSRSGGLGWFIYENQNRLETQNVFAGLLTIILIGLFVEGVAFRQIERLTVQKWGMQR